MPESNVGRSRVVRVHVESVVVIRDDVKDVSKAAIDQWDNPARNGQKGLRCSLLGERLRREKRNSKTALINALEEIGCPEFSKRKSTTPDCEMLRSSMMRPRQISLWGDIAARREDMCWLEAVTKVRSAFPQR